MGIINKYIQIMIINRIFQKIIKVFYYLCQKYFTLINFKIKLMHLNFLLFILIKTNFIKEWYCFIVVHYFFALLNSIYLQILDFFDIFFWFYVFTLCVPKSFDSTHQGHSRLRQSRAKSIQICRWLTTGKPFHLLTLYLQPLCYLWFSKTSYLFIFA